MLFLNSMDINKLRQEIKRLNTLYRAGTPEVPDAEYDALVEKLRKESPNDPWFSTMEPATINEGRKRKLPIPMKSLNKVKSLADIKQWLKSLAIPNTAKLVITPKYDGISWLHNEKTCETYSRGGAENEGQDCTPHYMMGMHYSDLVAANVKFSYGELVFCTDNWKEHFAGKTSPEGLPYKSPRNTIAGLINRDEPTEALRHTTYVVYGADESSLSNFSNFEDFLICVADLHTSPIYNKTTEEEELPFVTISASELNEERLAQLFSYWKQYVYIDGLVIYLNDFSLWRAVGRQQTTGNPLYAIAYKHPDFTDAFDTTVKGIDWKVSKAGALKPVVNIEAVDTGDCTMENPTGYNAKYIFENSIGKGADISVTRSGGVIPKILSVVNPATSETMCELRDSLLYCPDCGKPTKWNDTKVELICTNPDCPGIRLAKIVHFYNTLDAEQMGEETIAKLFKAGYDTLRRILDITFDEIVRIDSFGDSIANAILEANRKIREGVEVTKLMHSSDCFVGIGQVKAKSLLSDLTEGDRLAFFNGCVQTNEGFDTTPQFLALGKTMQSFLKGIVPFYDFIAKNNLKMLPMEEAPKATGDKYAGMKVCFTGIRDKELETEIIAQGGDVVSGVSKKTTHLIVADHQSSSSKTTKAKSLNIPIFTVEEFKSI